MSVDQSGGLRMEIGVLYLSHAMLVLAELIVCSRRGFACILPKWFWPTEREVLKCDPRSIRSIQSTDCSVISEGGRAVQDNFQDHQSQLGCWGCL